MELFNFKTMAHFAKINENNIVTQVIVVNNSVLLDENGIEQESIGIKFLHNIFGEHTNWKQCSYSQKFRGCFPGIGHVYIPNTDTFIAPVNYPSWTLDTIKGEFVPPIPRPISTDGTDYYWDEDNKIWVEVLNEPAPPE